MKCTKYLHETSLLVLMIFGIKETSIVLTHTVYFLAITTNIPQRLKTGFVLQGHIYILKKINKKSLHGIK